MQQDREHTLSCLGLSSIPGVSRATFRKLVRNFGSAARVAAATEQLHNLNHWGTETQR
jgi:excinuclease UvrABC nuclease subunit